MIPAILQAALLLATLQAPAPVSPCDERAELAWHISGGQDSAWENAIASCENLELPR